MDCLLEKTPDGAIWKCSRESCDYSTPVRQNHASPPKRSRCGEKPGVSYVARCKFIGDATGAVVECETCTGSTRIKLYQCELHEQCSIGKKLPGVATCASCPDYKPQTET
jgi:hypothetical protein